MFVYFFVSTPFFAISVPKLPMRQKKENLLIQKTGKAANDLAFFVFMSATEGGNKKFYWSVPACAC